VIFLTEKSEEHCLCSHNRAPDHTTRNKKKTKKTAICHIIKNPNKSSLLYSLYILLYLQSYGLTFVQPI